MAALSPMGAFFLFLIMFIGTCFLLKVNVAFGVGIGCVTLLIFGHYANTPFLQASFSAMDSFPFLAVPTFILAGVLMEHSGISSALIDWCDSIMGKVRGSVGAVTTLACMAFGLLTGSATATLSAIGKIMIEEMAKRGYKKSYAAALAASTSFLGILIPPSTPGILYALTAGLSITKVWMATVVPGLAIGFGTIFLNWWIVGRKEPKKEIAGGGGFRGYIVNLGHQTWNSLAALIMPIIIFGGIYSGIFTPTEAGAVCVVYGTIFYFIKFYKNKKQGKTFKQILDDSTVQTASIGLLIAMSLSAGRVITMCGVSEALTDWMLAHVHSKWTFLILYNVVLLLFGMFLNQNATILSLTPLLLETAEAYGISAMEFGTIMLVACCYGGLTPPFATYNFIAAGLSGESFGSVTKQSLPFLALGYIIIIIMCVFPATYMWLPNMVG